MLKKISLILLVSLMVSCSLLLPIENAKGNITLSVVTNSRTITPEVLSITKYSVQFNSNPEITFTNQAYTLVGIAPGTYNLIVRGYSNSKLVALKSLPNVTISPGSNKLPIELNYIQEDSGEINININWNNAKVNGFNASLKDLRTNPYTEYDLTTDINFDLSSRNISLTKTVSSTDYLLTINFLQGSNILLSYSEVVQVYKNLSSSLDITLDNNEFNTPPSAPTNLKAIEKDYGYKIEWNDTSNTETSYKIERKEKIGSSYGPWLTLDNTLNSNTESYADTNTTVLTKYKYRVTALNSYGSTTSLVIKTTDTTPPAFGAIAIDSRTTNSVTLSWSAAIDNGTASEDLEYSLYYSEIETIDEDIVLNGIKVFDPTKNKLSETVIGLSIDKKYYFTVVVKDSNNNNSLYPVTTVKMNSDTQAPISVTLENAWYYPANAGRVLWNTVADKDTLTYKLYYSKDYSNPQEIENFGIKHIEYKQSSSRFDETIHNLSLDKYYFVVVAEDDAGNKSYSNVIEKMIEGTPVDNSAPNPGLLTISNIGDLDITLSWSQADDASSSPSTDREDLIYKIYYSDSYSLGEDIVQHGMEYNTIIPGTVVNSSLSHKIDKLIYGTRYYFTVKVIDEAGNFSLYNVANAVTTIPDVLPDIRIKEVTPGERAIHVDLDQEITIYFYDKLTPESVDNITVYANRVDLDSNWNTVTTHEKVNGTISYDNEKRAIIFIPNKETSFYDAQGQLIRKTAFIENSAYQITIENVSSTGGEYISWDFRFKTLDYTIFTSHWKLDNNGDDSSGKNRTINNINADFKTTDKKEGTHSIYLNGNQNASIDDLMLGDKFTVTAWVNMDFPMKQSLNTIIANTVSSEKSNGFKLCVNKWFNTNRAEGEIINGFPNEKADKRIVIEVGNGVYGGKFLTDPDFVLPSGWYHLAFVIDKLNKIMKIYFNGNEAPLQYVSEDSDSITPDKETFDSNAWNFKTDGKFFFGSFYNTTDYGFKGHIDDMRAYNSVLTNDEIAQIATQNY